MCVLWPQNMITQEARISQHSDLNVYVKADYEVKKLQITPYSCMCIDA